MSKAADKQKMLDENSAFGSTRCELPFCKWISRPWSVWASSIRCYPIAHESATRALQSQNQPSESHADFIDLHAYPGFELNLRQYMENFGLREMQVNPIITGEFGSEVKLFASIDIAARRFVNWQIESCKYGFDSWIVWTWDLTEQPDFFDALMDKGQIEKALAHRLNRVSAER